MGGARDRGGRGRSRRGREPWDSLAQGGRFLGPRLYDPVLIWGNGVHWEASQLITDPQSPNCALQSYTHAQIPEEKLPESWGVDLGGLLCLVSAPG